LTVPTITLVPEHEALVDLVRLDLGLAVAAGDAGEDENAVSAQHLGRLPDDWAEAGRVHDQVERPALGAQLGERLVLRAGVDPAELLDEVGVSVRLLRQ
jgi:hypothetical protein